MTALEAAAIEQSRQVIVRDRFDLAAWDTVLATMPEVGEDNDRLSDVSWTAERGFADMFQTLLKGTPEVQDEWRLDASFRPNHRIVTTMMGLDPWRELRSHTVGDPFLAGMAMGAIADELGPLYQKLAEAQRAADEASAAREALDQAAEASDTEPGSGAGDEGDEGEGGMAALADAVEAADAAADQLLDQLVPVIASAMQDGMEAAVEAADGQAESLSTWSIDGATTSSMDPAERLALAKRLDNPRTAEITACMGRMLPDIRAVESASWDVGTGELARLTYGRDLNRVLPSELVGLSLPILLPDFVDRFESGHLLQYEYREHPKEARGTIVLVEDSSGTMKGQRNCWARAFGLSLLDVAARQGRGFRAIVFAGAADGVHEFDFGDDASKATLEDRLAYAEFEMDGGTWFQGPLDRAASYIAAEHEATGRTSADIVFATDGHAGLTKDWLADWAEKRDRYDFNTYGVVIGPEHSVSVDAVSDFVTTVNRFVDGTPVTDVFRAVQAPREHL